MSLSKITRPLTEFFWAAIPFVTAIIITLIFFGFPQNGTVSLQLYDTYFAVPSWIAFMPPFLVATFLVYFVKCFLNSFASAISNFILLVSGLVIVISITVSIRKYSNMFAEGWSILPPMSAMSSEKIVNTQLALLLGLLVNYLIALQIGIILLLLYAMYRWGRNKFT